MNLCPSKELKTQRLKMNDAPQRGQIVSDSLSLLLISLSKLHGFLSLLKNLLNQTSPYHFLSASC